MAARVSVTPAAAALIGSLRAEHGELLFHQSGGCCDGSAPMCYQRGEFQVGAADVYLGEVEGCAFYIGAAQYQYWQHTHLTLDLVEGRGSGFSLEAPRGVRFLIRSRLFTDRETCELQQAGPPPRATAETGRTA